MNQTVPRVATLTADAIELGRGAASGHAFDRDQAVTIAAERINALLATVERSEVLSGFVAETWANGGRDRGVR